MQENKAPVTCGLAISSIIVSLLFLFLFGLAGLILGVMAMIKISNSNGSLVARG